VIMTDRDEFVGFHLTFETKEALRREAERRDKSMSLLLSEWVEDRLPKAQAEKLEPVRSNKRREEDIPLPFED